MIHTRVVLDNSSGCYPPIMAKFHNLPSPTNVRLKPDVPAPPEKPLNQGLPNSTRYCERKKFLRKVYWGFAERNFNNASVREWTCNLL